MEHVTAPIRDLRQRPGTPSPAAPKGCEDEGQRYLEDMSASEMSDKYPAGCNPYPQQNEPDTRSNAGRDRGVEDTDSSSLSAKQHHDSRGNTGRDDAQRAVTAEAPLELRNSSTRCVSIDVRLTVDERERVRDRARVRGFKPAALARAFILDGLDGRSTKAEEMESSASYMVNSRSDLAPAVDQLRRAGINLNQALRKNLDVNDGLLRDVLFAVNEMRTLLGDRTEI